MALKAEVEILQNEGITEIEEQVKAMGVAAKTYAAEKKAALATEIEKKRRTIEIEEKGGDQFSLDPFKDYNQYHEHKYTSQGITNVVSQLQKSTHDLKYEKERKKSSRSRRRHKSKSMLNNNHDESIQPLPPFHPPLLNDHLAHLSQSMMKLMKSQSAPDIKIDDFGGDALE